MIGTGDRRIRSVEAGNFPAHAGLQNVPLQDDGPNYAPAERRCEAAARPIAITRRGAEIDVRNTPNV